MTQRKHLKVNGVRLSYIDFGGTGAPVLALHGHYSCARTFAGLADALFDRYRLVALDQRGHGWSDSPNDYSRKAYVTDAAAVIRTLDLSPAVVLGHSLGGVNAYQLAARYPELVRALVVEDIGAEVHDTLPSEEVWPERFESFRAARDFLTKRGYANGTYFLESVAEYEDGWGFRFSQDRMFRSRQMLNGDWWRDWLASACPALLLHGRKSWAVSTAHIREMASRRPNTRLIEFPDCGHTIHDEDPIRFHRAVEEFLACL